MSLILQYFRYHLFVFLLLPAACGLNLPADGPIAPGHDRRGQAVDGLTVGHRLLAAGEGELALQAYYRAAAKEGVNSDILSALGSANLQLGRLGQAEQLLRRALELEPDFVPALNNLGVVLMEKGETGEAARVFQRAFALDSGKTDAIRKNLKRALAKGENSDYPEGNDTVTAILQRQGPGSYALLTR